MTTSQRGGIIFRLLALMALCLFAGIVYLARHPLMQLAASFWIVQDRVTPADVIIVIGDDNFSADRATEAAALFKAGWAPLVVASGRMLRPYASLADLMAKDLESRGVPASAVVLFSHRATDTREEAEALRVLVAAKRMAPDSSGHFQLPHAPRALHLSEGHCRRMSAWRWPAPPIRSSILQTGGNRGKPGRRFSLKPWVPRGGLGAANHPAGASSAGLGQLQPLCGPY